MALLCLQTNVPYRVDWTLRFFVFARYTCNFPNPFVFYSFAFSTL